MVSAAVLRLHICMLIFILSIASLSSQEDVQYRRSSFKLCGKQLTQALQLVCNSCYASPSSSKRSDGFLALPKAILWNPSEARNRRTEGFLDTRTALSFLPQGARFIRQSGTGRVADECCRSSCTVVQLQAYCGECNDK